MLFVQKLLRELPVITVLAALALQGPGLGWRDISGSFPLLRAFRSGCVRPVIVSTASLLSMAACEEEADALEGEAWSCASVPLALG